MSPARTVRRILVVDDDRDIRETLGDILNEAGFQVEAAQNGQEALERLKTGADAPAAVLLDLMMPVMDGRTFLRITEGDPEIAAIPVIVITADGNCAEIVRSYRVQDCLRKPFTFDRLMAAVEACA